MKHHFLSLAIASLFPLLLCTPSDDPMSAQSFGVIEGTLVTESGSPAANDIVWIEGTSFISMTDTGGHFRIYNVPEGTYQLSSYFKSFEITVTAGDTTSVGEITIDIDGYFGYYWINEMEISLLYSDSSFYLRTYLETEPSFDVEEIDEDSVIIQFDLWANLYERDYSDIPPDIPVNIRLNRTSVYAGIPEKGRVTTDVMALTGRDTLTVTAGKLGTYGVILFNKEAIPDIGTNSLFLITGGADLEMCGSWFAFESESFVVLNADTFCIDYDHHELIDWDIYLVNEIMDDTCYWHNRNPEWSAPGSTYDSPVHSGDFTLSSSVFATDVIAAANLDDGVYSVLVKYYDGPSDSAAATPRLNIELGGHVYTGETERFYQISPPEPMHKGDIWYAGVISFPEKTFSPLDQHIIPVSKQTPIAGSLSKRKIN